MNKKFKKTFILQIIFTFMSLFSSEKKLSSRLNLPPISSLGAAASAFYLTGILITKTIESFDQLDKVIINEKKRIGITNLTNYASEEKESEIIKVVNSLIYQELINPTDENVQNFYKYRNNVIKHGLGSIAAAILGLVLLKTTF